MAKRSRHWARNKVSAPRLKLSNGDKVHGSWEKAYGEWLIENEREFVTHPRTPLYYEVPRTGARHRYSPDFYVKDEGSGVYVEITPQFALDRAGGAKARKLRRVAEQNPDIRLLVLTEVELKEMGVDI